MRQITEFVLAATVLASLFAASLISSPRGQNRTHAISNATAGEVLMIADGTDPMPKKR